MRTRIAKFKVSMPSAHALLIACAWLLFSSPLPAATVAWWRFEAGPADVMVPHGAATGVFAPDIYDYSGNGNHLSVWHTNSTGFIYRTDRPCGVIPSTGARNNFSVQNSGEYPCMFTQTGTAMQMMTPAAFTIEVSFKPEVGGWRTLVGRDSQGTMSWNMDLPALYLQITPEDAVAIKFCDVSGYWHEAVSSNGLIRGFTYPDSSTGQWYHLAAVSDGANLSLYLDSDFGYRLVARTDMTDSGSPNTALTAGLGSGSGWAAGIWSVGRGLYGGVHTDRAYGLIDEVRISDRDLAPEQFLFWRPKIMVINPSDSGPGSLRAALESAVDGDTIDARGVGGMITLTNGELYVGKSVAILGPGPEKLTVSGDHACRVFNLNSMISKNVNISGLRIANGTGTRGGGIYNYRGTLTLTNCALSGNSAVHGGGIYNEEGTVALTACTLSTNSTEYYAGGDNVGGGICNFGTLTLTACTLSANSAHDRGGGIYTGGMMMLETCTLSANSATNYGGGICNSGVLTLAACTLSANSAEYGGGIYHQGTLTISYTILNAGVLGKNIYGSDNILSWGFILISDDSLLLVGVGSCDPMLGPLQDNGGLTWTHALLPGSPAIDVGDDSLLSTMSTDQRGLPRKAGAYVDIGAYEVQQPIGALSLGGLSRSTNGAVQFNFTNAPGVQFAVQTTTNIALPMTSWPVLTNALIERPPGFYQFSDSSATNNPQRFYRVRWEH